MADARSGKKNPIEQALNRQVERARQVVPKDPAEVLQNERLVAILKAIEQECGVPWIASLCWLSSICSALLGGTVKVHVSPFHTWVTAARLWSLLIGLSGTGKSLLYKKLLKCLQLAEELINDKITKDAPEWVKENPLSSMVDSTVTLLCLLPTSDALAMHQPVRICAGDLRRIV
jgi:hypothetical protein